MKLVQGSVWVKIKEYVHAWLECLFVSLLVIFNFFPQINHFYYFTSPHDLLKKYRADDWQEKIHISAFPMYYSLYNWIGEHEITKLKQYIFALNPEKRTQKQAQKDMNEME